MARLLVSKELVTDKAEAARLARFSEGSLERAGFGRRGPLELPPHAAGEAFGRVLDSTGLAQAVATFIDEAGKESPARRARFRQVIAFAADFIAVYCTFAAIFRCRSDPEMRASLEAAGSASR